MGSVASISTLLVTPLVGALAADPTALSAFFRATDLTMEMVLDPEGKLSPAQFCVAWSEAERLSGNPELALSIAKTLPQGAFGVVEYVCRSAPTFGEALRQWVRYLGILDDAVRVGVVDLGRDHSLRVLRESEAPAPASHELCFAVVVSQARRLTSGEFSPSEVNFEHASHHRNPQRYREFFGTEVSFGARHSEVVFPAAMLEAPLETADPNLLTLLQPAAERLRVESPVDLPLSGQVLRRLQRALSEDDAQLESVAQKLGLTPRSLQRRLKDEGTSFQHLRDRARRELADRYLGEGHSLSEIAFLLGFSEPSAFFRAFKRWTGVTPIERRMHQRQPA